MIRSLELDLQRAETQRLDAKVSRQRDQIERLLSDCERHEAELAIATTRIAELEGENLRVRVDLEYANGLLEDYRTKASALRTQVDELERERDENAKQLEGAIDQITAQAEEIAELRRGHG